MPNFVNDFIDFTKEYESPESFWRWSAYSLIGAVLRDNVFIEHKLGKVYPNMYMLLLADSAVARKSGSFGIVEDLFIEVGNSKCFSGSASVQGMLEKLSQDIPLRKGAAPVRGGSGFVIAEELSSFFVEDPRLVPLLTRMSDYKSNFPYDLRGSPIHVRGLCMSMLMASNFTLLKGIFNFQAVYGGLLRRTLVVRSNEKRKGNSLWSDRTPAQVITDMAAAKAQKDELIRQIKQIALLKGKCNISPEAVKLYDTWYNDLYGSYEKHGSRAGVIEGLHAHVQKVAIAKTAAKGNLDLGEQEVKEAIIEVSSLLKNYDEFVMGAGRSTAAEMSKIILQKLYITPGYKLSRSELLLQYWMDMSTEDLEKITATLVQAGILTICQIKREVGFELTQKGITLFEVKTQAQVP